MAGLDWRNITLPLREGVDTTSSGDAFPVPKFKDLRNVDFRERTAMTKAPGFQTTSSYVDGSSLLYTEVDFAGLSLWRKQSVLWCDDGKARTRVIDGEQYLSQPTGWQKQEMDTDQTVYPMRTEGEWLQYDVDTQYDCCIAGNTIVSTWMEPNSAVGWYEVRDRFSGAIIYKDKLEVSDSVSCPKVRVVGNYVQVFYIDINTTAVKNITWLADDPGDITKRSLKTNVEANYWYHDVCVNGNHAYLIYLRDPGEGSYQITILKIDDDGALDTTQDTTQTCNASLAIDSAGTQVFIAYCTAGVSCKAGWYGTASLTPGTEGISVFGAWTYGSITCATDGTNGKLAVEKQEAAYPLWTVYGAQCSSTVKTSDGRHVVNSQLFSRMRYDSTSGEWWFAVSYYGGTEGGLQNQVVLLEASRYVSNTSGTQADGDGVNLRGRFVPGAAVAQDHVIWYLSSLEWAEHYSGASLVAQRHFTLPCYWSGVSRTGVDSIARQSTLGFANRPKYHGVMFKLYPDEINKAVANAQADTEPALYVGGAMLHSFDGRPQEANIWIFPQWSDDESTRAFGYAEGSADEPRIEPIASGGGGELGNNEQHSYKVCWEWINDKGQREQSTAITYTGATTGATGDAYEIVVRCNPYTNKTMWLAVYRAGPNPLPGDPFYRVSAGHDAGGTDTYVENDPANNTVTWTDKNGWNAAEMVSNEQCYLDNGGPDNMPFPGTPVFLTEGQNRLFGLGALNDHSIYYSKQQFFGDLYSWNEDWYLPIPASGGKLMGIVASEDTVLVFRETAVYLINGTGPDNLGNGFYSDPQLIANGIGLSNRAALRRLPNGGVLFLSNQGWHLLDAAYRLTELPDAHGYRDYNVVQTALLPHTNLVYIACDGDNGLVYDYAQDKWAEWETLDCWGISPCYTTAEFATTDEAVLLKVFENGSSNTFVYEHRSGGYLGTTKEIWTDSGTEYGMYIDTGWIDLDEGQGEVGAMWWQLAGEQRGDQDFDVRVRVAYNNVDTWVDDYDVTTTNATHGDGKPFTIRKRFSNRKLRSVRFLIEDQLQDQASASQRCSFTSIVMRLAPKNLVHRHNL